MNIHQILFPTDFSTLSKNALQFALEIAEATEAKVTILHVLEEPYDFAPMIEEYNEKMTKKIYEEFNKLENGIRKEIRFDSLSIDTLLLSGNTKTSILEEISKSDTDLVVMGTKGANGIKKILFGTVTTDIIMHSHVPVLAIPEHSQFHGFDHLTFTTDYHDGDLQALETITGFARLFNSNISIVHVEPFRNLEADIRYRGFRELVKENIEYPEMDFHLVIKDDFNTGISYYLDDQITQLLSLLRYKKPFFQNILQKNHTKQLGFYTKIPLLVLPMD